MWKIICKEDRQDAVLMEQYVMEHGCSHFMQLPRWAQVKSFWDWRGILLYRDGKIAGAMSVLIRPLPLGFSLFYAPRGPVCDRNDRAIWEELMAALRYLARQHRAILLYLDPDEPNRNQDFRMMMKQLRFREQTNAGFGNIQPQHVFRLDLRGKSEMEIFEAFSSKTRYNIRLAQRKGVKIREYSGIIPETELNRFSELMQTTGQRDHFQVRGTEYFHTLLEALGEDARLLMAYHGAVPIAGAIEVFCGEKAWYLYGASSNDHRNLMPNYLLQWTMILRALERHCRIYDFRGVPGAVSEDHPLYGLYRFKKGFSGTYTTFTGLFVHSFLPMSGFVVEMLMKLRRKLRSLRKNTA